ncbi:MAG: GNAT family N-acetyltransferase [Oscillospiraceae bacterium]
MKTEQEGRALRIRPYRAGDNPSLAALFYATVHAVNAADYSPAQLAAWAPGGLDADAWGKAFESTHTLVAEQDGAVVGFANVDDTGYFDRLYVHKDHQRKGVASRLAAAVEAHARANRLPAVRACVSITARPFFLRRGYRVLGENMVPRRGQVLKNYTMEKVL